MQAVCKLYASFMQASCKLHARFMQAARNHRAFFSYVLEDSEVITDIDIQVGLLLIYLFCRGGQRIVYTMYL
jgi:hypothetical protein